MDKKARILKPPHEAYASHIAGERLRLLLQVGREDDKARLGILRTLLANAFLAGQLFEAKQRVALTDATREADEHR